MQQAELQAIVENAPFFIYTLDVNLCLTNANKRWFDAYEVALGITPTIGAKLPITEQPISVVLKEAYQRTLAGEICEVEDIVENPKTGFKIYFELHLSPIREQEKTIGILAIAWDISEKKQNQSKLADWEIKYQKLMDDSVDAIFTADAQSGYIIHTNKMAQEMMGMTASELQKMHHTEIHPERLRQTYTESFQTFAKTGIRTHDEFLVLNKAGKEIPVDISSNVTTYQDKSVIQGVFRDISRQVADRQALQKQKEFYETILNNIPVDVAVLDENDRYTYLNPKAVKDTELRQWLIGKKVLDYYQYRNLPIQRGEQKQKHLNIIRKTKEATKWEDVLIDKNGKKVCLLRRFTPVLDEKSELIMSVFTGENVTHLKQAQQQLNNSEQRYKNLVETTTDWIWETNSEGDFTYSSPQIFDILGYTPREVVGQSVTHFAVNKQRKKKWLIFKDIWATGNNFLLEELEYQHKNGKVVLLQTSGAPVYNEHWELTHYRGIARDVTSQKNAEHLLQNTLHELKDRNFELDSFVYKVSHDLRAPLSSMLGLLNLMEIEDDLQCLKEFITMMQGRAHKLDNFIKTVLTYSQNLNQGTQNIRINFEKIVSQCIDELQYMTRANHVRWALVQTGNTEFCSDEFRLITIFKNFISNAIKYQKTDHEESSLDIHVHITPEEAKITIKDDGIGIQAEYLPRIFDMFYRATEKSEGSGLGLYIVKQTLDKLNGTLHIESVYGESTTIFLILPNHYAS